MAGEVLYKELEPAEWLDDIIAKGVSAGASDIHLDPLLEKFVVHFRIDGVLHEAETGSLPFLDKVISRLKIMAQLDITENRKPADGHILFKPKHEINSQLIDLRISVFPTVLGSAAAIRILNRKDLVFKDLENLGLDKETAEKLKIVINRSGGMVLVTGPGGSGKTTTLYTFLSFLQSAGPRRNIVTLEDPAELYLPGIRQSQIRPEIGYSFADGLRSILRQDPDVVMVGEIRDDETAETSIRAALMGALFFSTMHTINSVGAITRFLEFGLPRSLVASALLTIIAQRLVKTICPHCKTKIKPGEKIIGISEFPKGSESKLFRGNGCGACSNSGYLGRAGIFEVMFVDREIQRLIIEGSPFTEIEKKAKENSMKTLKEAAIQKALEGVTTAEEVVRVIPL